MNIQLKTQGAAALRPLTGKVSLVTGSTSGIGLGIARALAEAGSAVVLNGFGIAAEIAKTRDQIAADFDVEVSYSAADMTQPGGDCRDDRGYRRQSRPARYSGQQCRHPACRAARAVSGREMGRDPVDQPVVGVSHHAAGVAGDASEQVRADHQHRVRAWIGRVALQGGLCRGQARHRRPDQGRGAGDCGRRHHLQCDLSRVMSIRRWSRRRSTARPRRTAFPARKSSTTCCWRSSPTSILPAVEELGALTVFLASDAAASITGTALPVDGGWTAH